MPLAVGGRRSPAQLLVAARCRRQRPGRAGAWAGDRGLANTNAIIAAQGPIATSYAAGLARAYNGGGYSDWYLPSADELDKLYLNRAAIGGFLGFYWSSTEISASEADWRLLGDPYPGSVSVQFSKTATLAVRAVRMFPASALSPAKSIISFSFQGLSPSVIGTINAAVHTIVLTVPVGTNVTSLAPTTRYVGLKRGHLPIGLGPDQRSSDSGDSAVSRCG